MANTKLLSVFFLMVIAFSCKKSADTIVEALPSFQATINGTQWKATEVSAIVNDDRFVIKGATPDGKAIYLKTKDTIGTATVFRPMPAMLISLRGALDSAVSGFTLKWLTHNEQNLKYFQIERSNDAHNFTAVNNVVAVGTPATDTSYTYHDKPPFTNVLPNIFYYRLKMINLDSSYSYSPVLAFKWPWTCLYKYDSSDTGYAYGLHGTLQVTQLDKTKKTISGTFNFTYINSATGIVENVQNGSFENIPY